MASDIRDLESAVSEAAYGSAVQATWEQPNDGQPAWVRRDPDDVLHAGDPFGRFLNWLHDNGHRRAAAIGVHRWVTTVCQLTELDPTSEADRSSTYDGILWAASFPQSEIDSVRAVAALDAEGARY